MPAELIPMIVLMSLPVVGFLAWAILRPILANKRLETMTDEDFVKMSETESVGAVVLKKEIGEYKGGGKTASYKMTFEILFLTDNGKKLVFAVPEELYAEVSEGQSGLLVTVNGNFLDFGDGK